MWNFKFFIPCYFLNSSLPPPPPALSSSPSLIAPVSSPATFLALYYIDNFHPVRTIISSSRINCLLKYSKPLASHNARLRTNFWYQRDPWTICIFLRHDPPAAQASSNLCILLVNVIRFLRAVPRSAKAADKFFTNRLEASWPTSRQLCPLFLPSRSSQSLVSYITMRQGAFVDVPDRWTMNILAGYSSKQFSNDIRE